VERGVRLYLRVLKLAGPFERGFRELGWIGEAELG